MAWFQRTPPAPWEAHASHADLPGNTTLHVGADKDGAFVRIGTCSAAVHVGLHLTAAQAVEFAAELVAAAQAAQPQREAA